MRILIVTALFACAAALPPVLPPNLAPAVPTISAGDINGAIIDAQVEANDQARAVYDATREVQDKVNEIQGQAENAAEEQAWRVVDAVKTEEARLDGAAAAAAPVLAKQIARSSVVPAPIAPGVAPAPVVPAAAPGPVIPAPASAPLVAESAPSPVVARSGSAPVSQPAQAQIAADGSVQIIQSPGYEFQSDFGPAPESLQDPFFGGNEFYPSFYDSPYQQPFDFQPFF